MPFSEVDRHCSLRDAYFLANIQVSLSVISVANVFALWYDKSHKSGLSEMRVSQNNRKGKNAEQMLHDANDLKSYQMIWLGQRIFVMTTASFAHLMKKESKTDEKVAGRSQRSIVMRFVKGKLHQ